LVARQLNCEFGVAADVNAMPQKVELKWSRQGERRRSGGGVCASTRRCQRFYSRFRSERAGKAAFDGVDTAAVRAWAAADGLIVSPRPPLLVSNETPWLITLLGVTPRKSDELREDG